MKEHVVVIDLNHDDERLLKTLKNLSDALTTKFGPYHFSLDVEDSRWNFAPEWVDPTLNRDNALSTINKIKIFSETLGFVNKVELSFTDDGLCSIAQYVQPSPNFGKNTPKTIEFVSLTKAKLDKIFPPLDKEDYKLIAGRRIVIPGDLYAKSIKNGKIKLGNHEISSELWKLVNDNNKSELYNKVVEEVREKFVNCDEVVDALITSIETGKNCILWGRGGHGKSEITSMVLDILHRDGVISAKPFVQAFGEGLTEDKLFGGMDLKLFNEKGRIVHLTEYSFLEHEIVVFEEIFDAPPNVLLSLKDVMTSGAHRQGHTETECKTKVFIGLTNRDKSDFAEKDDSLKALTERFPVTYKVEWNDYSKKALDEPLC